MPTTLDDRAGPSLSVSNVVKRFGKTTAVDNVSFTAPGGTFLSLLGPSGSGKTTILRMISGFESPDEGAIQIASADITHIPPFKRNIGVVFQSYALFPHMSVAENVAFPLKQRRIQRAERQTLVKDILETVGLPERGDHYPSQLSGGEQQRVALARALVFRPRILVMDEPLSALDRRLRERMQQEIRRLQQHFGLTTIYVTHDQSEAFAMSDYVAVMHDGRIEQVGEPRELYERPANEFVATFLGDSNIISGEAEGRQGEALRVRLNASATILCPAPAAVSSGRLKVLVRPENVKINCPATNTTVQNLLKGRVTSVSFIGELRKYRIAVPGADILVHEQNQPGVETAPIGAEVELAWQISDTSVVSASSD